jgi:hypothetical protein
MNKSSTVLSFIAGADAALAKIIMLIADARSLIGITDSTPSQHYSGFNSIVVNLCHI